MSKLITAELGGSGVWGVEFFVFEDKTKGCNGVYFSELSPRPHDTGMVTMTTQYQNEFELHLRAILGWDVNCSVMRQGRSHVISSQITTTNPKYTGLDELGKLRDVDFRIFGKPNAYPGRRMGIVLTTGDKTPIDGKSYARRLAESVEVVDKHVDDDGFYDPKEMVSDFINWVGGYGRSRKVVPQPSESPTETAETAETAAETSETGETDTADSE